MYRDLSRVGKVIPRRPAMVVKAVKLRTLQKCKGPDALGSQIMARNLALVGFLPGLTNCHIIPATKSPAGQLNGLFSHPGFYG